MEAVPSLHENVNVPLPADEGDAHEGDERTVVVGVKLEEGWAVDFELETEDCAIGHDFNPFYKLQKNGPAE